MAAGTARIKDIKEEGGRFSRISTLPLLLGDFVNVHSH